MARKIYYAMEAEEDEYRKEHELDDIMFSSDEDEQSDYSSPMSDGKPQNNGASIIQPFINMNKQ